MNIPNIKDEVKDGKLVRFVRYEEDRDGNQNLWYETESGFEFPISSEEAKGGTFHAEEKAMMCMRWIRKRIDFLKTAE